MFAILWKMAFVALFLIANVQSFTPKGRTLNNLRNIEMITISFPRIFGGFKERTEKQLKEGIAKFYDESSQVWLDVWGEHMHHGYYDPTVKKHNHKQAQIDMIDNAINWSYGNDLKTSTPKTVVDVGCGVGGSSRHIMKRFGMTSGQGLSLSPFQIKKAQEFTSKARLHEKLTYQVADALVMPFNSNSFDLTWSMESGEHMPDKEKFMNELVRVTAPGGRIIVVTWCHRELCEGESDLKPWEHGLLQKINDAYYLPKWVPVSKYVELGHSLGLQDVRQADWSDFVKPFWAAVFFSALVPSNFIRMLKSGWTTIKGAIATLWMLRGFQRGVIKFVIMTGRKPAQTVTETPTVTLETVTEKPSEIPSNNSGSDVE